MKNQRYPLSIGLVKLCCLILAMGGKGLNPWELDDGREPGFMVCLNVFSSIFFLKECDLFQIRKLL